MQSTRRKRLKLCRPTYLCTCTKQPQKKPHKYATVLINFCKPQKLGYSQKPSHFTSEKLLSLVNCTLTTSCGSRGREPGSHRLRGSHKSGWHTFFASLRTPFFKKFGLACRISNFATKKAYFNFVIQKRSCEPKVLGSVKTSEANKDL